MKMNKKGFTLIELLAIITILGAIIGIAVVSYNAIIVNSKNKYYKIAEDSMIAAAEGMYEFCETATPSVLAKNPFCNKFSSGDSWTISLKELEDNNFMQNVANVTGSDSECSKDEENSYVLIKVGNSGVNTKLEYKVKLKCGDYTYEDTNWRK